MIVLSLKESYKSVTSFRKLELPDLVVITGLNGSGKTNFLKAISDQSIQTHSRIEPDQIVFIKGFDPADFLQVSTQQIVDTINTQYERYRALESMYSHSPIPNEELKAKTKISIEKYRPISRRAGKHLLELTRDDFFKFSALENSFTEADLFQQNFALIFTRYQELFVKNLFNEFLHGKGYSETIFLNDKQFTENFGPPPWLLLNEALAESNLDYSATVPLDYRNDPSYVFKLIRKSDKIEIKPSDLSSGEKVLISLVFAMYNKDRNIGTPKLLLMDEPDASLHPSMAKQLIDIILNVFVNKYKIKVIITSHSPSTIAFSPEESIYVMEKGVGILYKASKDEALTALTFGVPSFSVNYENRRQVFVESKYDVKYYEFLYRKFSAYLIPEISLTFISSGDAKISSGGGSGTASCDQVISFTDQMRKAGNNFVWGIIDRDAGNQDTEYVKVLGGGERYSIENYLLDPLLVTVLLVREKFVDKEKVGLRSDETHESIRGFDGKRVQEIVGYLINEVAGHAGFSQSETELCTLMNGRRIKIPKWFLNTKGHDMEEMLLKVFPALNGIKKQKEDLLKMTILEKVVDGLPELVPIELIEVLKSVQE